MTSQAQSLGQVQRAGAGQGQGYMAKLGAARVALARQWGNQTPQVWKGGIPKPLCMVSISPAAFSHVQKHCVRSIHALECPMAAGWPLPLATAHMEPAHHVTLRPLRSSQNDSTSGSWQGAEDRQVRSSAPRAAVPAGLVPIPLVSVVCVLNTSRAPC